MHLRIYFDLIKLSFTAKVCIILNKMGFRLYSIFQVYQYLCVCVFWGIDYDILQDFGRVKSISTFWCRFYLLHENFELAIWSSPVQ